MAFKIRNVTNLLDKRHPFLNTSVEINYVRKNVINETIKLGVGEELIFDSEHLPTSIHNLRIKQYIRVTQITGNDVAAALPKETNEVVSIDDEKTSKNTKKK